MQALLVLAHPLRDSLCAHLAGVTAAALQQRGAGVDMLDLYAEGFDPLLSASERTNYYGTPAPAPDITAQQARLAGADVLVLVFPTWWFAVPAILKGWFDRVWAPGFAYDHGTPITPRLTRLKSCLVVRRSARPGGSTVWLCAVRSAPCSNRHCLGPAPRRRVFRCYRCMAPKRSVPIN